MQPQVQNGHVFVSYASADRARVGDVVSQLARMGVSMWMDEQDIEVGELYTRAIAEALEQCQTFMLFCSARSLTSRNVVQEIVLAWKLNRRFLPILLEPVSVPIELAYFLEGCQYLRAFGDENENWLDRLVGALRRYEIERADAPSRDRELRASSTTDPFLPYLVDRDEQDTTFSIVLDDHIRASALHAIPTVIHGNEQECLDSYLQRLWRRSIPRALLRANITGAGVIWKHAEWPNAGSPEFRLSRLRRGFTDALDLPSNANPDEIHAAIIRTRQSLAFAYHLDGDIWQKADQTTIESWLAVLAQLIRVPSGQLVLFMFSIKYGAARVGFWERRRARKNRQMLGGFLTAADLHSAKRGLCVLNELESPTLYDVENWVRIHLRPHDLEAALATARESFRAQPASNRLPMALLAPRLRELAKRA